MTRPECLSLKCEGPFVHHPRMADLFLLAKVYSTPAGCSLAPALDFESMRIPVLSQRATRCDPRLKRPNPNQPECCGSSSDTTFMAKDVHRPVAEAHVS